MGKTVWPVNRNQIFSLSADFDVAVLPMNGPVGDWIRACVGQQAPEYGRFGSRWPGWRWPSLTAEVSALAGLAIAGGLGERGDLGRRRHEEDARSLYQRRGVLPTRTRRIGLPAHRDQVVVLTQQIGRYRLGLARRGWPRSAAGAPRRGEHCVSKAAAADQALSGRVLGLAGRGWTTQLTYGFHCRRPSPPTPAPTRSRWRNCSTHRSSKPCAVEAEFGGHR